MENRAIPKIGRTQAVERGTVLGESVKYRLAIFFVGADEKI